MATFLKDSSDQVFKWLKQKCEEDPLFVAYVSEFQALLNQCDFVSLQMSFMILISQGSCHSDEDS